MSWESRLQWLRESKRGGRSGADLTWAQAEAAWPECSPAWDRDMPTDWPLGPVGLRRVGQQLIAVTGSVSLGAVRTAAWQPLHGVWMFGSAW